VQYAIFKNDSFIAKRNKLKPGKLYTYELRFNESLNVEHVYINMRNGISLVIGKDQAIEEYAIKTTEELLEDSDF
jgi:hypothetical protein